MKVFISSTFVDLVEHRHVAAEAIERLQHEVSRMETFNARPADPVTASLDDIDSCDLFVGIYAHRYGSMPSGSTRSITEMELEHAVAARKPVLCFVIDDDYHWPPQMVDRGERAAALDAFKSRVLTSHTVDRFTNPSDLAYKITAAVSRFTNHGSAVSAQSSSVLAVRDLLLSVAASIGSTYPYLQSISVADQALMPSAPEASVPAPAGVNAEQQLRERTLARIREVELSRQVNLDTVIQDAIGRVAARPSEENRRGIDADWMRHYLDYVKDVSNREIQSIWAEILARQATLSGRTISLLTLDALRLMESHHARVFHEIARRVVTFRTCFPFRVDDAVADIQVTDALNALVELGFITLRQLRRPDDVEYLYFPMPGFALYLSADGEDQRDRIPVISEVGLTFRGTELGRVILGKDLIALYEDFRVPALEDPYEILSLDEQTNTLKQWFTLLKEAGYKVSVLLEKEPHNPITFIWDDGLRNNGLVPWPDDGTRPLPLPLQPLLKS